MIELSISCNDCGELAAKVSNMHSQMPFLAERLKRPFFLPSAPGSRGAMISHSLFDKSNSAFKASIWKFESLCLIPHNRFEYRP